MKKVIIIGANTLIATQILANSVQEKTIIVAQEQNNPFEREPIKITATLPLPKLIDCYDKKGKLFELPKSKFHK